MILYRYEASVCLISTDKMEMRLREFPVIKETPKGAWIDTTEDGLFRSETKKHVRYGVRSFAHRTKEAAWTSFCARQQSRLTHATRAVQAALTALEFLHLPEDERDKKTTRYLVSVELIPEKLMERREKRQSPYLLL